MAKTIKIAVLPGDGVGPEVTNEAVKVLGATDLNLEFIEANVGGKAYVDGKLSAWPEICPCPEEAMGLHLIR